MITKGHVFEVVCILISNEIVKAWSPMTHNVLYVTMKISALVSTVCGLPLSNTKPK